MAVNEPRFVEVYRARNIALAHLLAGLIEQEGIPVQIENDLLQGAVGDIPMGWSTIPRILVEAHNGLRARAIAEEFDANQATTHVDSEFGANETDSANCLSCGKPLPEDEDRCPACGWSYDGQGE
jgi:hypothetical protein